jgi:archaellum component FlaG (FlaF/FlaG flagellin family)
MSRTFRACFLLITLWMSASAAMAENDYRAQMKGLDEQVQEVKSDVLSIAADLTRLEERLLYPSNTQVSLFVELVPDESFRLDSVQISINGEAVAHHIYSFKELEALAAGGVQRIYTGNVPTGEHSIAVSMAGKLKSGSDFSVSETFPVTKGVEPKLVGIRLSGPAAGGSAISVGDW